MKISVDRTAKEKKPSRAEQFQEIIWNHEILSGREKTVLSQYAYWLAGNSRIGAKAFCAMVDEFVELVPPPQRINAIISATDRGYRNITPPWFRDGYVNKGKQFDNLADNKKVVVGDINYDEVF